VTRRALDTLRSLGDAGAEFSDLAQMRLFALSALDLIPASALERLYAPIATAHRLAATGVSKEELSSARHASWMIAGSRPPVTPVENAARIVVGALQTDWNSDPADADMHLDYLIVHCIGAGASDSALADLLWQFYAPPNNRWRGP